MTSHAHVVLEGDFAPEKYDGLRAVAIFGEGGLEPHYRYSLEVRGLMDERYAERPFVVTGLNPSKATHVKTDNTISKLIKYARREKCGRLIMTNAYPFRATEPADMWKADASGVDIFDDNERYLCRALERVWMDDGIYLAAWGSHPPREHERRLMRLIREAGVTPMCLDMNKDGSPTHPLYQPDAKELREWTLR